MGYFMGGFDWFSVMFTIMGVVILGFIIFVIVTGLKTWNKNNNSPRLKVDATVVTKRLSVSGTHHNHGDAMVGTHVTSSTTYYVTFQVESGDRIEFMVHPGEYGMMVEGDTGFLTFQGSRFIDFVRR